LVIRLTFAAATPGARSSERCTRALQEAHVIPVTGMVARSAAWLDGGTIALGGDCGGDPIRAEARFVVPDLRPPDLYGLNLDAIEASKGLIDGVQAMSAGHALDV
jgi:hypothetical protein